MKAAIDPEWKRRRFYGLSIASDIDLPELEPSTGSAAPDVTILEGEVREVSEIDPTHIRAFIDGSPGRLRLDLPGKVRILIANGRTITYSRYPGIADDELRLFLLGSAMGALLMQREHVVVHGNAIVFDRSHGASLCIGESGAGKSTTAIGMMQRGHRILADDVCPIDSGGMVPPGMPRAKLWQDTAHRMGIDTDPLARLREGDAKYNLPLGKAHCCVGQPVRAFFWLVPEDVSSVSARLVEGTEKFTVLRNNIYRPEYLRPLGLEAAYLQRVADIASAYPVYRVSRPVEGFDIEGVLDTICAAAAGSAPTGKAEELTKATQ